MSKRQIGFQCTQCSHWYTWNISSRFLINSGANIPEYKNKSWINATTAVVIMLNEYTIIIIIMEDMHVWLHCYVMDELFIPSAQLSLLDMVSNPGQDKNLLSWSKYGIFRIFSERIRRRWRTTRVIHRGTKGSDAESRHQIHQVQTISGTTGTLPYG